MRKIVTLLCTSALLLALTLPAAAENAFVPAEQPIVDAVTLPAYIDPIADEPSLDDAIDAQPTKAPRPGSTKDCRLAVKYYLTEGEMGSSDADVAQYVRAIIRDYNLSSGTYYLCSGLDTSYPDERATLTISEGQVTIAGNYLSREYTFALR